MHDYPAAGAARRAASALSFTLCWNFPAAYGARK